MSMAMMEPVVSSPEEEAAAAYLAGVGPIVAEGSAARQALVNGLTALREAGSVDGGAPLADEQGETFRVLRQRLGRLKLPRTCGRCHAAVARWLELHEAACMTITAGGPKALTKAGELIADGRAAAQEFTSEYSRLTALAHARAEAIQAAAAPAPALAPVADEPPTAIEDSDDELQLAIEDAADVDDADELAVEALAEALAEEQRAEGAANARDALNVTARRNGDAAWVALSIVAQHRGRHASGPLGSWLAAVEGVLAASAALTALIVAAEVALD
jgi:hypothetical protein